MASAGPQNAGTGSYVEAPENVQPQQPIDEQLSQLKIAARDKINTLVDSSKQQFDSARNDPTNRQAGEQLKQDVNTTAQDATHSYNTALQQLGEAFRTAEVSGQQIAQQMGVARDQAAVGVQDATTAARQQAQQKSQDAQLHAQGGKSALQQGISTVQEALSKGAAAVNQTLQGAHSADTTTAVAPTTTENEAKALHAGQDPTLLQSVTAFVSKTALSVKDALVGKSAPSPTANSSTSTPTTTNHTVTHPPAQTITESVGQTATALKDTIKETLSPAEVHPANNVNPAGLPEDVPRRASE